MDAHEDVWRSPQARALIDAQDVGGLIKFARQARGWRQADLGRAIGYSAPTVSRLESRRVAIDLDTMRRIARAVQIPPHVLGALLVFPVPPLPTVATTAPQAEEDPMHRRTLLTALGLAIPAHLLTTLDDALAVLPAASSPPDLTRIAARLAQARDRYDMGDLTRLIADLPDLLAAAHEASDHHATPDSYALAAGSYDLATVALNKIGRHESSRLTADRATMLARLSGSPVSMAASARCLGIVLRHEGRASVADQVVLRAIALLESTGLTRPSEAAIWTQMLCAAGYNSARLGDRDRALAMIREASQAAARLPVIPGQRLAISPAHVTGYEVSVHWRLGDAGAALHAGRGLHPSQLPTPERRGRLHTDLARAWWQWGKPEQTALALLAACRESVPEVRDRPAIRSMAVQLIERHPRTSGVRELAGAIGYRKSAQG
ncbi:helix-turn-helix transcriptional regulator [Microtetraspora sp. AC03309]|uniref:helix-turn-helix domain-containing protein n=1 Tax=Microtetraspora sp. AC03309 TaxID=2779376 RepID=UPI001E5F738C|nr:helix-turn-helix transcriptional regulator [Microtetraspora sp. AC03309]MCC5574452.1 helix-turn-helix transcriptional regulator [Microtetraspora sp. AC03309]